MDLIELSVFEDPRCPLGSVPIDGLRLAYLAVVRTQIPAAFGFLGKGKFGENRGVKMMYDNRNTLQNIAVVVERNDAPLSLVAAIESNRIIPHLDLGGVGNMINNHYKVVERIVGMGEFALANKEVSFAYHRVMFDLARHDSHFLRKHGLDSWRLMVKSAYIREYPQFPEAALDLAKHLDVSGQRGEASDLLRDALDFQRGLEQTYGFAPTGEIHPVELYMQQRQG